MKKIIIGWLIRNETQVTFFVVFIMALAAMSALDPVLQ